jgi:hypothetical protein
MSDRLDLLLALRLTGIAGPVYNYPPVENGRKWGAKMNFWGKLPPWAVMASIGAAGLLMIAVPRYFEWAWDHDVISEIGIALLAASILGFTIERWMLTNFARDIFQAAIGYILREELREEVNWICGFSTLATKSVCIVKMTDCGDGTVEVTWSLEREIENISANTQEVTPMISADNWGVKNGTPKILRCEFTRGDDKPACFSQIDTSHAVAISAKMPPVALKPKEKIRTIVQAIEYKRANDILQIGLKTPTVNPQIEVHLPPGFDGNYGFAHRGDMTQEEFTPRKTLKGTFLPGMSITVRWWPIPLASAT